MNRVALGGGGIIIVLLVSGFLVGPLWQSLLLSLAVVAACPFSVRIHRLRGTLVIAAGLGLVLASAYLGLPWGLRELRNVEWGFISLAVQVAMVSVWVTAGVQGRELPLLTILTGVSSVIGSQSSASLQFQPLIAMLIVTATAMVSVCTSAGAWEAKYSRSQFSLSLMLPLTVVVGLTSLLSMYLDSAMPSIRRLTDEHFGELEGRSFGAASSGPTYMSTASLNSIALQKERNPQSVCVAVKSDRPPGHLRGQAYTVYRQGRWNTERRYASAQMVLPTERNDSDSPVVNEREVFRISRRGVGTTQRFEITNATGGKGIYFGPLGASRWSGRGDQLVLDQHQIPRGGLDIRYPYVAYVEREIPAQSLDSNLRAVCLDVPDEIASQLKEEAERLVQGNITTKGKAYEISDYFQSSFTYSLDAPASPDEIDPVLYFLQQKHPAHCEYFASATCLLLRSVGIPARYVTGFVVDEAAENEDRKWLGRNKNFHAWVEAYDDRRNRWFLVESTPGMDIAENGINNSTGLAENRTEVDDDKDNVLKGNGFFASLSDTKELMRSLMVQLLGPRSLCTLLTCIVLALFFVRYRKAVKHVTGEEAKRLDRAASKLGVQRRPSETLHGFAERLMASGHGELAQQFVDLADRIYAPPSDKGLLQRNA